MFCADKLIRFHHCDPAGIVFYPQYFVLFHELLEDWFAQGLGLDYAQFVRTQGMGLPTVKLECEFLAPVAMGEVLRLELSVQQIGASSLTLAVLGSSAGRDVLRATQTLVHAALAPMRAQPIPEALRTAMAAFHPQDPDPAPMLGTT